MLPLLSFVQLQNKFVEMNGFAPPRRNANRNNQNNNQQNQVAEDAEANNDNNNAN